MLAKFRAKLDAWLAEHAALASMLALLEWNELGLFYWVGDLVEVRHYQQDVADEIELLVPGLGFHLTDDDLAELDKALKKRVSDKDKWQDPVYRASKNKQRTVRKGVGKGKAKAGSVGYVGGGTVPGREAALDLAVRTADPSIGLVEFHTEGLEATDFNSVNAAVTDADRTAGDTERRPIMSDSESEAE